MIPLVFAWHFTFAPGIRKVLSGFRGIMPYDTVVLWLSDMHNTDQNMKHISTQFEKNCCRALILLVFTNIAFKKNRINFTAKVN